MQTDYIIRENGAAYVRVGSMVFHTEAKKEYQRQRDEELGRWRDPVEKNAVVYRMGDWFGRRRITVSYEDNGYSQVVLEGDLPERRECTNGVAERYFAAHPEKKPLPSEPHTAWVDKYGKGIWWVNGMGELRCCASPSSDPEKYAPFTRLVPEDEE